MCAWRGRRVAWARMGSGPAVVLCHGTPWSSRIWQPFAEALSADHTVYLWDMPGYGASSMDAEHPVDFGVQGELLSDLIAGLGARAPARRRARLRRRRNAAGAPGARHAVRAR